LLTALLLLSLPGEFPAPLPPDDAPVVVRSAKLLTEQVALEASRPRLLAPILLTSGGIVLGLGGAAFLWSGIVTGIYYAFSFAVGSVVLFTIGAVFVAAAIPLFLIGAVKWHRARKERARIDERLEQLQLELATF